MVHQLSVTLEDLYNGVTKKLALQKNVICEKCEGKDAFPQIWKQFLLFYNSEKSIDLFKYEGQKLQTGGLRAKPILFGPVHLLFGLHIYLMCCQLF